MNVTAHQEKKKKETKTGKRRPGEKRKQATDFKKPCATLLQSFRGQHSEKMKGVPGVTGTLWKSNSHFDPTQMGSGLHYHVEAAVELVQTANCWGYPFNNAAHRKL